eukprot:scaffold1151_cov126-Isochrysis_galbana.AAC.12
MAALRLGADLMWGVRAGRKRAFSGSQRPRDMCFRDVPEAPGLPGYARARAVPRHCCSVSR